MFGRTKESLFIQQPTFQKTDLGGKFNIAIYIITFYNYITDIYLISKTLTLCNWGKKPVEQTQRLFKNVSQRNG